MTIYAFPPKDTRPDCSDVSRTLRDWPWDPELGKPHGDINGPVDYDVRTANPELYALTQKVKEASLRNDLAHHKDGHPGFAPPSPAAITLAKAISLIDGERDKQHGERHDNFGMIAKLWTVYVGRQIKPKDVAWMMVLLKAARESNGNHNMDNAIDAAGYAALAGELAETSDNGC